MSVGRFQRTRLDSLPERRVRLVMAGRDVARIDDRCPDASEHVYPGTASGRTYSNIMQRIDYNILSC